MIQHVRMEVFRSDLGYVAILYYPFFSWILSPAVDCDKKILNVYCCQM